MSTSSNVSIEIGDAVMLGPDCKIIGGNHDFRFTGGHMRYNNAPEQSKATIEIENGVWIGAGTIVLTGASLGEGCVVGAASVVTGRVPPYSIAVGSPARFVRLRFANTVELAELLSNVRSRYTVEGICSEIDALAGKRVTLPRETRGS